MVMVFAVLMVFMLSPTMYAYAAPTKAVMNDQSGTDGVDLAGKCTIQVTAAFGWPSGSRRVD